MTFYFPYIHILNLKEKEKEQALLELGEIGRKKEAIMVEHRSLEQKRNLFLQQAETRKGTASIADIQQRNEYLTYINQQMSQLEEQINLIDKEMANKKLDLLDKQKDEKTWNHLREKAFEKYVQKQKKIEQDLMDEIATIRHFHQRLSI
ncbi:flagellar export protein FliJ [Bacillus sp. OK048]|uniref:flagellar export protein FliJ n=1 Tax=Bacillus sp. OK048 TaxID=1882761 RepID=UPI00087EB94D|nr:flagellar export protein FliJ [Bacillus sp. OK048]SDM91374.1 flagellar export protein FliJ [Bacillus sp. OK048]